MLKRLDGETSMEMAQSCALDLLIGFATSLSFECEL